jgi:hypothetical protein
VKEDWVILERMQYLLQYPGKTGKKVYADETSKKFQDKK